MTDWTAYEKLNTSSEGTDNSRESVCAECEKNFSRDDMIRYGESWVCAGCKPVFVQKLKEGVNLSSMDYAGFWIRVGATIIDSIIIGIVNFIISFSIVFIGLRSASPDDPSGAFMYLAISSLLNMIIYIAYETYLTGKWGATVGKMACGLKVVTAEGEKITYLRSFARYFAKIVSSLILLIGYIIAAFDDEKRGLHDRICNTRVIRK